MPNAANVSAGKPKINGAVYRAPAGTTLPTTATETLNGAFTELGFVSEDGVTNNNTAESDNIKAWGGQVVLVIQSEKPDEWTFTLLEVLNPNVLETVYGSNNVSLDGLNGTITVEANAEVLAESSYVIDMALNGGAAKRVVIPAGKLSEVGEIVYKDDEAVGYELTVAALPDSSGNNHYEYIVLPAGTVFDLSIDKSTLSVAADSTAQIVATTTPSFGHVIWGTSDPETATVDQSGLVTGVTAGSCTITATYAGITKSCTVTVT